MIYKDKYYTVKDLSLLFDFSENFIISILNDYGINIKFKEFYTLTKSELEMLYNKAIKINPDIIENIYEKQIEIDLLKKNKISNNSNVVKKIAVDNKKIEYVDEIATANKTFYDFFNSDDENIIDTNNFIHYKFKRDELNNIQLSVSS